MKGKPTVVGKDRVSIRVQLSRKDYVALCKIAEETELILAVWSGELLSVITW